MKIHNHNAILSSMANLGTYDLSRRSLAKPTGCIYTMIDVKWIKELSFRDTYAAVSRHFEFTLLKGCKIFDVDC